MPDSVMDFKLFTDSSNKILALPRSMNLC